MKDKPANLARSEQIRQHAAARYGVHLALRSALSQWREKRAPLRLQTTHRALANRRLLREIKRMLKARS